MLSAPGSIAGLDSYRRTVRSKNLSVHTSTAILVSYDSPPEKCTQYLTNSRLLKRRQVRGSRDCAEATAYLLRHVVQALQVGDVSKLLGDVQQVGQKLIAAQPKELAIGNVVRRILGLIREEAEEDREGEASGYSDSAPESRSLPPGEDATSSQLGLAPPGIHGHSPLRQDATDKASMIDLNGTRTPPLLPISQFNSISAGATPAANSMLSLLSHPASGQTTSIATPGAQTPGGQSSLSTQALANLNAAKDLRAEVAEGIEELLDELRQADDQIAGYALEQIHSSEIILTNSSSRSIQKFLLKAAAKRKFTVIQVEAYPNSHETAHEVMAGQSSTNARPSEYLNRTLTAAGVTVILVPDAAVFALMARVNKVILDAHLVLSNGSSMASSGARLIAHAAKLYRTPVIVLGGVYKISPVHPFDSDALMELGDPGRVIAYKAGDFRDSIEVHNPLFDYVPADLIDLYITNLGGHAPSSLFRLIDDHYRTEDLDINPFKPYS